MKIKTVYVVTAIIILVHLIFLIKVLNAGKGENTGKDEQAVAEEQNGGDAKGGEKAELKPVQEELPPMVQPVEIPAYSAAFFQKNLQPLPAQLNALASKVPAIVVADMDKRVLLYNKNGNEARPIASLTKMMTTYLAVKKMKASGGQITLETPVKVTKEASTKFRDRILWISPKETFTVNELLKASLVHSANDCAYLLAQYFGGGKEQAFVQEMNQEAAALGCGTLRYSNSNGLPDPRGKDNCGAALELAYLAIRVMEVPEIMRWTGVKQEYLREKDEAFIKRNGGPSMLTSSNTLLGRCKGVNGLKTGFTNKAGFCIVATCEREGRHLVVVVLGAGKKDRDRLAGGLLEWAYALPQ